MLIAVPLRWHLIGLALSATLFSALIFLGSANYSKTIMLTGRLMPEGGVAVVSPTRVGVISHLYAAEGDLVESNALLMRIRVEESAAGTNSLTTELDAALERQDAEAAAQSMAIQAATRLQIEQSNEDAAALSAEIGLLAQQLQIHLRLVHSAATNLAQAKLLEESGATTPEEVREKADKASERDAQTRQLKQSIISRQAALERAVKQSRLLSVQGKAQLSGIAVMRAQVSQQRTSLLPTREYAIRAPTAGLVTGLTATVGQQVLPGQQILAIVPQGGRLRGELSIPASANGSLKKGQMAKIAIDGFPYQRFGTVDGKLISISSHTLQKQGANSPETYLAVVDLAEQEISADGARVPLRSGMTLSARVTVMDQNLLQWLFDPFYAVGKWRY